jgi:pilus assembly protein CpaB
MFKGKTALVVALALGLGAALLAYNTLKRHEDNLTRQWTLTTVVVASQDIPEGSVLDYDMVAKMDTPEQFVTASVVQPKNVSQIVGQKVMVPLQRGDPILWNHFYSDGFTERMSRIVNKRGRAFSLDIAGSKGVAGWVRPADHVDILGTFKDPKNDQLTSVTLLQNVVVLATGAISGTTNFNALDKSEKGYGSVTLEVFPEEAEILSLAAELGNLRLTLRNPEDIATMEERNMSTIQTIMTGERLKTFQEIRKKKPPVIVRPPQGNR